MSKEKENKKGAASPEQPEAEEPKQEEVKTEKQESSAGEIAGLKKELEEKTKLAEEYLDKMQRVMAEYDNYRKRTIKERDQLVTDTMCDAVSGLLPILDNMERAMEAAKDVEEDNPLKKGFDMVIHSFQKEFEKLGVTEIEAYGKEFDPNMHNAVMHVEDDSVEDNTIIEVFQKGYAIQGKVIRHIMVKVAN